jgi:hypothetical protein
VIPQALTTLDRWAISTRDKNPITLDGSGAKINDPTTWATYERVIASMNGHLGPALMITPDAGLIVFDFDGCIADGVIHPEAQKLVDKLATYTEISASGTGLHVFAWGAKPPVQRPWTKLAPWGFEIEMFDYHPITLTGNRLADTPTEVQARQDAITEIYFEVAKSAFAGDSKGVPARMTRSRDMAEPDAADYPAPRSPKMSNEDVLALVKRSKNAGKFEKLWIGDMSDYRGDHSRADAALLGLLSFYTQDPEQLVRLFSQSVLGQRGKWDRDDYRERTLSLALAGRAEGEVYELKNGAPMLKLPLVPLSTIPMVPVPWLWPGYFPRSETTLLVGDPGNGKTLSSLDLTARITTGAPWPDGVRNEFGPQNVIVLSAEDAPEYTIRPRVEAAGGDASRVLVIPSDKLGKLSLEDNIAQLRDALEDYRPLLLILDPLSAYMPGIDDFREGDVRSSLLPFVGLLKSTGTACIAVKHMSKNVERSALHRVLGSVAFTALTRAVFMVTRDPDAGDEDTGRRLFVPTKFNLGKEPAGRVFQIGSTHVEGIEAPVATWERDTAIHVHADDLLRQLARPSDAKKELHAAMLELVAAGPILHKDALVALARFGKKDDAIVSHRKKLGIETLRDPADVFSGPYYWLPLRWDPKARDAWTKERIAQRQPPVG